MKKIICFILTAMMLLGMTSCHLKKEDINDITQASEAARITSIVSYVGPEDTLTSKYVTEIDHENQLATFSYAKQRYATLEEMSETRIVTDTGLIHYKMDTKDMTADGGESWTAVGGNAIHFDLKLQPKQFKTYETYDDGNSAKATLDPEHSASVLGTEIKTKDGSDIELSIITGGIYLYQLDIAYTAESGARVLVQTTYNYEKITLDFSSLGGAN